jgi:CheY-like chemotaxis protein
MVTRRIGENSGMSGQRASVRTPNHILIVEDSENAAAPLEMALLAIPGVAVRCTSSGKEALEFLSAIDNGVRAVVTDLNMPRMDGFELIGRIRQDPRFAHMPIIVVSADTDPATPRRVAQLGADAYFPKPYSPAEVRRKLEQLLDATTD